VFAFKNVKKNLRVLALKKYVVHADVITKE